MLGVHFTPGILGPVQAEALNEMMRILQRLMPNNIRVAAPLGLTDSTDGINIYLDESALESDTGITVTDGTTLNTDPGCSTLTLKGGTLVLGTDTTTSELTGDDTFTAALELIGSGGTDSFPSSLTFGSGLTFTKGTGGSVGHDSLASSGGSGAATITIKDTLGHSVTATTLLVESPGIVGGVGSSTATLTEPSSSGPNNDLQASNGSGYFTDCVGLTFGGLGRLTIVNGGGSDSVGIALTQGGVMYCSLNNNYGSGTYSAGYFSQSPGNPLLYPNTGNIQLGYTNGVTYCSALAEDSAGNVMYICDQNFAVNVTVGAINSPKYYASGTAPVADGTYTVGGPVTPVTGSNGTITTKGGIITAVSQAT